MEISQRVAARPKTSSQILTKGQIKHFGWQSNRPITVGKFEALVYQCQELPNIDNIKNAISRCKISSGTNYILPVDKGRNSINNKYRTDLRAMFMEPYYSDKPVYNDEVVSKSAKMHFQTNKVDTKWTKRHAEEVSIKINSDSEKVRRLYARSAPTGGAWSRRLNMESHKLKKRSQLFIPIKQKEQPEAERMRKEAEKIIKCVQEKDDEFDEENAIESRNSDEESLCLDDGNLYQKGIIERRLSRRFSRRQSTRHIIHRHESYSDIKDAKATKAKIPNTISSPYLTDDKNQTVWDWLHHDEELSDFDYFLSVCG